MTFPIRNDAWCDFASASSFSADCFSSVFLRLFSARSITSARKRSWSLALSPCFALCGAASTLARSPCTFLIAWSYSSRVFEICAICKQGTKCESAAWFYLCLLSCACSKSVVGATKSLKATRQGHAHTRQSSGVCTRALLSAAALLDSIAALREFSES